MTTRKPRRRGAMRARSAGMALGVVLLGAALTRGDGRDEPGTQKVHLELRTLVTGVKSATFPGPSRLGDLAVGESQDWSLIFGRDPRRHYGAEPCTFDVSMPGVPQRPVPDWAVHVWETRMIVRAQSVGMITLEVDWKRLVRGTDSDPVAVSHDSRVLSLLEGQRVLLDFVDMRAVPEWTACYANIGLELQASINETPELVKRRIGYDLWLVDEAPGAPTTTRRWQMAGQQGELREFDFEPVRQEIRAASVGEGTQAHVDTRVFGHVRGRVRDDGSLEVALQAEREDTPEHRHWVLGGHGEKLVHVAAGETIRLELPPPSSDPMGDTGSAQEKESDRRLLAGLRQRQVSLVLTARDLE